MESSKLKNIILIILIVTNVLLLGLVLIQRTQERQSRREALDNAVELLARRGISVQIADLPDRDFPMPMVLEQDQTAERETFTALLGEETTFTQRGLVSLYQSPLGQAEVRENGAFTVELKPGAYPLGEGQALSAHAGEVLSRRMGISGQVTSVRENAVTVTQTWDGSPVFSCQLALVYREGSLIAIAGTRLSGEPTADAQAGSPLSIATLLVRFRAGVIDSGDACTAILSATQGYTLSGDSSGKLRLTPVLRLETDTNLYVLNALNGALSRA